jgi:uncharacterized RDD family membrane protein YckC
MTQPYDPNQPPQYGAPTPPPYGAPPPAYGAPPPPPPYGGPGYGGYGPPPGQRVNDPAPMGMRLLARIMDGLLLFVISIGVSYAVGLNVFETTNADGTHEVRFQAYNGDYYKFSLILLVITTVYEVAMLVARGATLGKMAVGVRVARLEDGTNPDVGSAFIRSIIPGLASFIPFGTFVVFLSPFFDSTHRNRGWYDQAAKTIAVRSR